MAEVLRALEIGTHRDIQHVAVIGGVFTTVFGGVQLLTGRPRASVVALMIAGAFLAFGYPRLRTYEAKSLGLCLTMSAIPLLGLAIFGPLLGVGILTACAMTAWGHFYGVRAAFVASLALCAPLFGLAAVGLLGGPVPVFEPLASRDWLRLAVNTLLTLLGMIIVLGRMRDAAHAALVAEIEARARAKEADEARAAALEASLDAQRLEAIGRLTSGVAHDFNNALAVVQGTLEALVDAREDERAAVLEEGFSAVRAASATTRGLLGLARTGAEADAQCEVGAVLERVGRAARRLFPATLRIEIERAAEAAIAMHDATLEQVLFNLIVNAADAMEGKGRVRLVCRDRSLADRSLVEVEIEDDGPGMSEEIRRRAFEPFFTTKPRDRGTGLGLAMVRSAVVRAGGEVELTSAIGVGTRVVLRFERLAATHKQPTSHTLPARMQPAPTTVLLVEDDEDVARTLRRAGCEVEHASSVTEAKALIEARAFAILLTDGILTDGMAPDVISAFRAQQPLAPVLLCTGYLDHALLNSVQSFPGVLTLHKPFSAELLLDSLARAMSRKERRDLEEQRSAAG